MRGRAVPPRGNACRGRPRQVGVQRARGVSRSRVRCSIGPRELASRSRASGASASVPYRAAPPASGYSALHGLFNCGQLEISTITSISARSSTYLPGAGNAVLEGQAAFGRHRHVHEEVDVRGRCRASTAARRARRRAGSCRGSYACSAFPAHSAPCCSPARRRRRACRDGRRYRRRWSASDCRGSNTARCPSSDKGSSAGAACVAGRSARADRRGCRTAYRRPDCLRDRRMRSVCPAFSSFSHGSPAASVSR